MRVRLFVLGRLALGPLAVGVFAGVQLFRFGVAAALLGGYVTFLLAEGAVWLWSEYRLRAARRRLLALRVAQRTRVR